MTKFSDEAIRSVVTRFEDECKERRAAGSPRRVLQPDGGYPSMPIQGMTKAVCMHSTLRQACQRFSGCDDLATPFTCVSLSSFQNWCHMALIKIRETRNEVPPQYPTEAEEEEMHAGVWWFFQNCRHNRTILETPKEDDSAWACVSGVPPKLFVSAGYIHVQMDFVHSAVMGAKGYLLYYWNEYGAVAVDHLREMKDFYVNIADKLRST